MYEVEKELVRHIRIQGRFLHDSTGGRSGQTRAMYVLASHPGITQREFKDILEIKPSSASEILSKLENEDLIRRVRDRKDQRQVSIYLTDKGREKAAQNSNNYNEMMALLFKDFSIQEKNDLLSLLNKLKNSWKDLKDNEEFIKIINKREEKE